MAAVCADCSVCCPGGPRIAAPNESRGACAVQVRESRNGSSYLRVITGSVVIIKHPSMHPGAGLLMGSSWPPGPPGMRAPMCNLHAAGDVRVMRAVDQPQLRHHVHELIFSVAGSRYVWAITSVIQAMEHGGARMPRHCLLCMHVARPASNMMPGSDMDGDQYAVAWDTSLIPTKPNRPAMDYTAAKPKEVRGCRSTV